MAAQPQQLMPANTGKLMSLSAASELLRSGRLFTVAGDEALLRKLPQGNWIGGSIPYFMGQEGGETARDKLFVTELPMSTGGAQVRFYDVTSIERVCTDAPPNGFSVIIIPAFSGMHSFYARKAPEFEDMYVKPLIGWIAGLHLDDLGKASPIVANGTTLEFDNERAVVMHVPLPDDAFARIDIVNLFEQGDGDTIRFPEMGFSAGQCEINGKPANLADYLVARNADTRLPLVADYCGAMVNVSIKGIDKENHAVDFYAPVFDDIEYRIARPVPSYEQAFVAAMPDAAEQASWSCNCILNYLYSELEGKRTGPLTGPMTFGEIAYQLLNQTLVYMTIER